MKSFKFIISGGGTGGHIFPAIAIARELKKRNQQNEILFVGAHGKMEMEKVPAAGFNIEGLWISGLQRRITISNLLFPFKLVASAVKARIILNRFKPDVAIGVGGFASGPLLNAAASAGVPCLIQEQNSYAGLTNKLLGRKVKTICVAYDGMQKFFPTEKIVITGNPVRVDIAEVDSKRKEAIDFFKLDSNKKTLLVLGGSLGARTINNAIDRGLMQIEKSGIQVIWQTGKFYVEQFKHHNKESILVTDFISRMDLAYAAADLVISRAGAISISELCVAEKACILVPSPNVAEDHQTKNALALQQRDAAILVTDKEALNSLVLQALQLIQEDGKRQRLQQAIAQLAKPDATERIVDEIYKLIKS